MSEKEEIDWDEIEITPQMIEAGTAIVRWWESGEFSGWYENCPTTMTPSQVLAREVWLAMQAVRHVSDV